MRILVLLLLCVSHIAAAQDRAGNNTPGEWIVTHHKPFGLWDSMCDKRITGETLEQRCYLRYVDVFSPRPNFGALFAFITPDNAIEIGIEAGTVFKPDGLTIRSQTDILWTMPHRPCLFGGACKFSGPEAGQILQDLASGSALHFDFIDRHGTQQSRQWDLTRFAAALADLRQQSDARGL